MEAPSDIAALVATIRVLGTMHSAHHPQGGVRGGIGAIPGPGLQGKQTLQGGKIGVLAEVPNE
jgi:hypothetical protein